MVGRDDLSSPNRFLLFRAVVRGITMFVSSGIVSLCVQPRGFLQPRGYTSYVPDFWFQVCFVTFHRRFSSYQYIVWDQ